MWYDGAKEIGTRGQPRMTTTGRISLFLMLLATGACGAALAAQKGANKPKPDPVAALDDFKKWPARDFANATAVQGLICVYIKDAGAKNNKQAEKLEGADFLGNEEVRVKLRGSTRIKIKNDGSDSKGWPDAWLRAAENGALLVLFSSDKVKVFPFGKSTPKEEFSKEGLLRAIDAIQKHEADKRAAAEAKAKEEEAKKPDPANIPGLDPSKKPPEEKKPKPKPQETPVENE
jgi:hypothetical protein